MRGQATIQLIKNNEIIKEIKQENTITNAYKNLTNLNGFNFPVAAYQTLSQSPDIVSCYTPLAYEIFGGIMLFGDKKLDSNLENIISPKKSDFLNYIGCAGSSFSGSSIFRGTLNSKESQPVTGGYKFVWDFGTQNTNLDWKEIKRICLTSKSGGNVGLDNSDLNDTTRKTCFLTFGKDKLSNIDNSSGLNSSFNGSSFVVPFINKSYDGYFLAFVSQNEFITVLRDVDVNYTYTFKKFRIKSNIGINDDIYKITTTTIGGASGMKTNSIESLDLIELVESKTLTSSLAKTLVSENYIKIDSRDINNIRAVSFTNDKTNNLYIIRIFNLSNLILEEDFSVPINQNLQDLSMVSGIIFEDFLYTAVKNSNILYKINKTTGAYTTITLNNKFSNINYFYDTFMLSDFYNYDSVNSTNKHFLQVWNGQSFNTLHYYFKNDSYTPYNTFNNFLDKFIPEPIFVSVGSNGSQSISIPEMNVFTPFFSSILNLDTSVIKEAGTTLKIIYTITN